MAELILARQTPPASRTPSTDRRGPSSSRHRADQGGSAQIRIGKSPDLCYPQESPSSTVSTTEHTETASRIKIITQ